MGVPTQQKMYQGAMLELDDNVLFKGLKIANWRGTKQNTSILTSRVLREKAESSYSKSTFLIRTSSAFLASGLVQGCNPPDVPWSR